MISVSENKLTSENQLFFIQMAILNEDNNLRTEFQGQDSTIPSTNLTNTCENIRKDTHYNLPFEGTIKFNYSE